MRPFSSLCIRGKMIESFIQLDDGLTQTGLEDQGSGCLPDAGSRA